MGDVSETPREISGPFPYVWVEIHDISLHEESTSPPRGIGIKNWPATSELEAQIEEAKATHGRKSAMLLRKDAWERSQRYEATLRAIVSRHPDAIKGEHPAVDMARKALER